VAYIDAHIIAIPPERTPLMKSLMLIRTFMIALIAIAMIEDAEIEYNVLSGLLMSTYEKSG
jgi:hypothetical protein